MDDKIVISGNASLTNEIDGDAGLRNNIDGQAAPIMVRNTGTYDHSELNNRDAENQHPISAITGLRDELDAKSSEQWVSDGFVAKEAGKGLSSNDFTAELKSKLDGIQAGAEANVQSDWNAESGDSAILHKPAIPTKISQLTNDSGLVNAQQAANAAPVQSVNGRTGNVAVTEGLAPLIGYSEDITPAEVKAAILEGRDVCLHHVSILDGVALELEFTNFNYVKDIPYQGNAINGVVSQTIAYHTSFGGYLVWVLIGDLLSGSWGDMHSNLVTFGTDVSVFNNDAGYLTASTGVKSVNGNNGDVTVTVPTKVSDLQNDSNFVNASGAANAAPVQSVNGQTGAVNLTIPTNVSSLNNDAGYLTLATLPIYNGGVQ